MASVQDACQTTDGSPDRAAARGRPLTKGELDLCVTALRRVHAFASRAALRARFAVQQRRADEKWVYGAADRVDLVAVGLVRIRQPTESRHGRAAARSELRQAHGISGSLRNGNAILGGRVCLKWHGPLRERHPARRLPERHACTSYSRVCTETMSAMFGGVSANIQIRAKLKIPA